MLGLTEDVVGAHGDLLIADPGGGNAVSKERGGIINNIWRFYSFININIRIYEENIFMREDYSRVLKSLRVSVHHPEKEELLVKLG